MTTELPEEPRSREESYLATIAGEEVTLPDAPESRIEQYLAYIAENGGGGGSGTTNFNKLTNRPKYNGTTMTGDTNIPEVVNSAFTGTDGTVAGTAGLVPAPVATDADKFLKSDGTWADLDEIAFLDLTISDASHISDGYIDFSPSMTNAQIATEFTAGKTVVARATIPTSVGVFSAGTYYFLPSFQNNNMYFASGTSYNPQTQQWLAFTYFQGSGIARLYFKADSGSGTTETYTIATNSWTALSASSPYDYSTTVTATHTIGANTIAELINDNAVLFANHGFAIGSISSQSVTIYSIGQPSASVSLMINYKG